MPDGGRNQKNIRGPPSLRIPRQHQGENSRSSEQYLTEFVRATEATVTNDDWECFAYTWRHSWGLSEINREEAGLGIGVREAQ